MTESKTSVAIPTETRRGVGELVRTWSPSDTPWANVLIVHGIGEHSGRYERTGTLMAAAGLSVRSFDLIGFGASGGRRGDVSSWTHYLDQIEDNLEAMRGDLPLVLMGHSLGGLLALSYALSGRPETEALVLTAPALAGGAVWQRLVAPLMARFARIVPIPSGITGDQLSRDPSVGERYFSDPLVYTKATPRLGNELFTAIRRANDTVTGLDVPTLVIHGGADTVVEPRSTAILGTLPGVERHLEVGLRHEVLNEPEGPELVTRIIEWIRMTLSQTT